MGQEMTLKEARILFSSFISRLVLAAGDLGLQAAYDEVTNHQGKGHMAGSLHYEGCAGDLIIYDAHGNYLTGEGGYKELGVIWKSYHSDCKWGGDFKDSKGKPTGDYNHFSFSPFELFGGRA